MSLIRGPFGALASIIVVLAISHLRSPQRAGIMTVTKSKIFWKKIKEQRHIAQETKVHWNKRKPIAILAIYDGQ
jgi:hypothetical protein